MKFIRNKYYRWYYQIIDKARRRGVPDEYYEEHHIIPVCLGGKDVDWNLVKLTFREHYLVHWFLIKMTNGEERRKMLHALFMMNGISPSHQGRESPSWLYALAKKVAREARLGYKFSEESRIKMRNSHLGQVPSEETRIKHKAAVQGEKNGFFGKKHNAEAIDKIKTANLGRKHSIEAKHKISKGNLGKKISEETRVKISGTNHHFYGKNHTAESKEKIRLKLQGVGSGENNNFYGKKHTTETLVNMRKKPSVRSKSGLRGISKLKTGYSARIRLNGGVKYLGYFKTLDEAALAYKTALLVIEGAL